MSTAPDKHALLSPSGAHCWMNCAGSVVLNKLVPHFSSRYADEGSAAHELGAMALQDEAHNCEAYLGRVLPTKPDSEQFEVDDSMCGYVQTYIDKVLENADGNLLFVEQVVPIGHITGEENAEGTSDAIIIADEGREIQVHDLKYGQGVPVSATNNVQMMMYALGAVEKYEHLGPFERVKMFIHMPRIYSEPSIWEITIEELMEFQAKAAAAAQKVWSVMNISDMAVAGGMNVLDTFGADEMGPDLNPSGKTCRWCDAASICPAKNGQMRVEILGEMDAALGASTEVLTAPEVTAVIPVVKTIDNARLGAAMDAVASIENWCTAVRAMTERKLLDGEDIPGYKLVEGRLGNRAWVDEDDAEAVLKSMRLGDKAYTRKIISPTKAEELLKKESPRRWKKLQANIKRSPGKPSVATVDDERPALIMQSAMDAIEEAIDISDLA